MAEIFISHIHEEKGQAEAVSSLLHDRLHVKSFLSGSIWQLRAGEEWLDRIRSELQGCRVMISLLSESSVSRPWINFEAGAAWVNNKPVIPCCYAGLKKGVMPQPFASLHGLDMPDELYPFLVAVAHHLNLGPLQPLPPLPSDGLVHAVEEAFRGKGFWPPLVPPPTW